MGVIQDGFDDVAPDVMPPIPGRPATDPVVEAARALRDQLQKPIFVANLAGADNRPGAAERERAALYELDRIVRDYADRPPAG